MKTSKKILLVSGIALLTSFTISLVLLREQAYRGLAQNEARDGYQTLFKKDIQKLKVGENWNVQIVQGAGYRVQLSENHIALKDFLKWNGSTLFLKPIPPALQNHDSPLRIMGDSFQQIEVAKGARVYMKNFKSDSLAVVLQDSSSFTGENTYFTHSHIKTNGNANLIFLEDKEE